MSKSNNSNLFLSKIKEYGAFFSALSAYINKRLFFYFYRFENVKDVFVGGLIAKRGKYVMVFLHGGLTVLFLVGISLAPVISRRMDNQEIEDYGMGTGGAILGQSVDVYATGLTTQTSIKPRDTVMIYTVKEGETLSEIATKFGVSTDTIRWENDLASADQIKEGGKIAVPPVTGIVHKVKRGDTIYSIAKKYGVDAQAIVNWPYNSYTDDENFGLAVGQTLVIPDGVKPKETLWDPNAYIATNLTPSAGEVSATGSFIWPTSGRITQRYVWYHRALDIANSSSPPVLAADAGTVTLAGWPDNSGYANRVIIDHGNGFSTLYAHMASVNVVAGQTVDRGAVVGIMGSTGRSTGIHLHFEIRYNGELLDPLSYLR